MTRHRAYGIPRQPHLLREQQRAERARRDAIAAQHAHVLGAGPAKCLADCQTKTAYSSQPVAEAAATLLSWAGQLELEPYRCPWCDEHHLRHRRSA